MKASEKMETFMDRYSNSFEEYLSSVVKKLRDTDSEYKDIEDLVDTVTTGNDGFAKSKALYLGKYEIKEIHAPYGSPTAALIRTTVCVTVPKGMMFDISTTIILSTEEIFATFANLQSCSKSQAMLLYRFERRSPTNATPLLKA